MAADWRTLQSPETYTGYRQANGFTQADVARFDEPRVYPPPARLGLNSSGPSGTWTVAGHAAVVNEPVDGSPCGSMRAIQPRHGPASKGTSIPFRVFLDGQPAADAHGTDADADGGRKVANERTYHLIRQPGPIADRLFEIEFLDVGVEAYCFTFG